MLPLLQPKYQLILVVCLALCVLLFCTGVDARKRDGSDEDSSEDNGRGPWIKPNKKTKFVCPFPFGAFPDVEDCESYYVCGGGYAKHRKCPAWRKFDKYRRACLSIFIAVCEDGDGEKTTKVTTVKDKTTTPVSEVKFACPSFSGTYPHPEDCSKYYKCTFLLPILKTCPDDQLFDGVKKECKPANEVHCGTRKRPTTIAPSTEPITSEPTTPEPTYKPTTPEPTTPEPTYKPTTTEPPTPEPTYRPTTTEPPTPEPTYKPTTEEPTTPEPTTPEPTTPEPTTPEPTTPEATTPEPTTPEPTTPEPTTPEPTTPEPTTPEPTTPEPTTTSEPENTPPETDCKEDDLDCIIKETGEIPEWYKCPDDIGSYRHPSSKKLFIFCINKKPFVKRCGQDLVFSDELRTCVNEINT